jgi:hypothetical protein
MTLLKLIGAEKLGKMTRQYADAFGVPVFLYGKGKELLCTSSGDPAGLQKTSERPIVVRGSVTGYVAVPLSDGGADAHLAVMAETLAAMAEAAYEMDSLSAEVARNYAELSLLWKFSSKLGTGLNVDIICRVLADEVMGICPSRNISIMLAKGAAWVLGETHEGKAGAGGSADDTVLLITRVAIGDDAEKAASMQLRTDRGLVGYAFGRQESATF